MAECFIGGLGGGTKVQILEFTATEVEFKMTFNGVKIKPTRIYVLPKRATSMGGSQNFYCSSILGELSSEPSDFVVNGISSSFPYAVNIGGLTCALDNGTLTLNLSVGFNHAGTMVNATYIAVLIED